MAFHRGGFLRRCHSTERSAWLPLIREGGEEAASRKGRASKGLKREDNISNLLSYSEEFIAGGRRPVGEIGNRKEHLP